jgi:hypothetical protein
VSERQVEEALSRTVLLVNHDLFPRLSEAQIVGGLTAMRVRICSDAENLVCAAAQTAVVALAIAVTQTGPAVELCFPDVPQRGAQPPLTQGVGLRTALLEHLRRLPTFQLPHIGAQREAFDVVLGNSPYGDRAATPVLRVSGDDWSAEITASERPMIPWAGEPPFGGMLAAVAISAEVFRAAMRRLEMLHGMAAAPEHSLASAEEIKLGLPRLSLRDILQGQRIDIVSAGAITNAALFGLWRIPKLTASARIFDDDRAALSNCNRYPLLALPHLGGYKVDALTAVAPARWSIDPVCRRFDDTADLHELALARHVLVGADDIPTRWQTQRRAPDWLCVAATSHFEIVVSEHEAGTPCAGCMHPRDEPFEGEIPTIAFVSMLAGVLQSHRLLARLTGGVLSGPVVAWALALDQPHGIYGLAQNPRADCPVRCAASVNAVRSAT